MENRLQRPLSKCMALCSRSEKCVFDIQKKLSEWEIDEKDALQIIDELKEQRFLNDERYAVIFARDKFRFNHWGRVKIAYHLKNKNIEQKIIFDALDEIGDDEYFEKLTEMLKQKSRSVKGASDYEKKAKLIRFAQGRGFEYEIIKKALQ
ncbi:MAG TPA: regulatory protein RecX [Prolixibacteraceae bacterium]|nr:regulatory protein RecX [Prolixibacteraceae bacterium]